MAHSNAATAYTLTQEDVKSSKVKSTKTDAVISSQEIKVRKILTTKLVKLLTYQILVQTNTIRNTKENFDATMYFTFVFPTPIRQSKLRTNSSSGSFTSRI